MSDLQGCLTSFAVAAGAWSESSVENVERQIEDYLAAAKEDAHAALLRLKVAFEDMQLDGHIAAGICRSLDCRLALLSFTRE
ncbi:hypothetical protein ACFQI3_00770 [Hansschlegelia quercus]|uniref:Uncharacterized protein n=1 Tax=Hansschlegelia quercus TaxID=2528245 RepID=A0A4Q9GFM0_9HYPH|nr:hypothetical protein [Hansschlegelia quercus]TBN51751.1 hypothetical protein EYR15_12610 [Hansschlegelia quercus]